MEEDTSNALWVVKCNLSWQQDVLHQSLLIPCGAHQVCVALQSALNISLKVYNVNCMYETQAKADRVTYSDEFTTFNFF